MTRVIDGGCTRSLAARAPGLMAPSRCKVASTESWVSEICESARRPRRWRVKRTTASDSSLASVRTSDGLVTVVTIRDTAEHGVVAANTMAECPRRFPRFPHG